jgi:hypothetical protein
MARKISKEKTGMPLDPSEGGSPSNAPRDLNVPQGRPPQEGDYKNVQFSVNNPSYFDDDYEVRQDIEIQRDEARRGKKILSTKAGRRRWKG